MEWLQLITSVLISIAVAITSGKQIEVPSSKLMMEYNWPEPKKNLVRYPHRSCSKFYVAKPDGSATVKECPEGELFDFRSLRCRPKVLAKCWNDLLKKDHSKKIKRPFSCPFPWGLYPDVEDCSTFYDCLSGKPYLRKCPSSTLFDKAERTCVNENEALCADDSDIVEKDYKCPYKWGYFTYSKDCSKFYECLRKVPSLRSCKKNMLFDNLQRKCMPMSDVDCGKRFNPYEKNKQSTERVSTREKEITTENIPSGGTLETTKFTSIGEEATTGRVSNTGGETINISPTRTIKGTTKGTTVRKDFTSNCRITSFASSTGVRMLTKLTTTTKGITKERVSNREDGMTTKIIPTEGVQKITEILPSSEDVTIVRFSNGGDGMTAKVSQTGVQKITELLPSSEDVTKVRFSNGDGMTTKVSQTGGVQKITKLFPSSEDVTRVRFSNGGDGMTTKVSQTGGVQKITELLPSSEDVTRVRFSNGGDGMTAKVSPTGGVQNIIKSTPTSEDIRTNSNAEMTTRHIPTRETQETTKLNPTGGGITGHVSIEEERDKLKHISTGSIKTSEKRLTPEIIPVKKELKAADELH